MSLYIYAISRLIVCWSHVLYNYFRHITFKLCLLMHKIHTKRAPSYLNDKVTATADLQSRADLSSASTSKYQTPRTRIKFGERSFSYAGPSAWNSLPHHVREITDTTRFKRQLIVSMGVPRLLDFLALDLYPFLFVFTRLLSDGHFYASVSLWTMTCSYCVAHRQRELLFQGRAPEQSV